MALKIYLLGQFNLEAEQQTLALRSRPAQSLFAYLVLHAGMAHRRERLAGLLWPDSMETNARGYLRHALWRIRKAFNDAGLEPDDFLQTTDISVTFDSGAEYWLDAREFLGTVPTAPWPELATAVSLYCGELLPGFYDEWVAVERDRLHAAFQQRMDALLQMLLETQEWDAVLHWAEQWIRIDHGPEPAYRAVMQAFAARGNKAMVRATYHRCVEALERNLALEPGPELQALYARLMRPDKLEPALPTFQKQMAERPLFMVDDHRQPSAKPLFVARKQELVSMQELFNKARRGNGQIILVAGEAGSGKTALIQAFARQVCAEQAGVVVAGGNCNAQTGIGDPYLPFREILELLTGDVESQWAAGAITQDHARRLWKLMPRAAAILLRSSPDLVDTFVSGAALLDRLQEAAVGADVERLTDLLQRRSVSGSFMSPEQSDLFEQYTRFLHLLARQSPLVLLVDDLQWADLGSISLLFHLARTLAGTPLFIVGAFRSEELSIGREQGRHPFQPVLSELRRMFGNVIIDLDQAEGRDFVSALLDSEPNKLDESFRRMLYRQTRGLPLFTLELLRGLQERGDLFRDEKGYWIAGDTLAWDELPVRTEAVVAERIGRLAPALRAMLRVASVEGERFTAEVVARVQGVNEQEVLIGLSRELDRKHQLVRAESIMRKDGRLFSTYRFRHTQIERYLYSTLDEVERVHLHEQVGAALESVYADEDVIAANAVQLARHFREARIAPKATYYLYLAGKRALKLSAYREALNHLTPALEILQILPDSRERLQLERDLQLAISTAWMCSDTPSAEMEMACQRARDLSQQLGETAALSRALGGLAIFNYVRARHQRAHSLASEALALAEEAGDLLLTLVGHWRVGFVTFGQGDYVHAQEHMAAAIDLYEPARQHQALIAIHGVDAGASAMAYNACCLGCLGHLDSALAEREKALSLACELDHAFTLADVLCYACCTLSLLLGDGEALISDAQAFVDLAKNKGLAGWMKMAQCFLGEGLVLAGDVTAGITQIRESLAVKIAADERVNLPGKLGSLAQAYLQLGVLPEAELALAEGFRQLERSGERMWESDLHRLQGELCWARGDIDAATQAFDRALVAARRQRARSWELRAATGLARMRRAQGDIEGARELLVPLMDWFGECTYAPILARAKALLAELPYN